MTPFLNPNTSFNPLITWKKQGEAFVGAIALLDGRKGNAVVVGPRGNPKGATLILPKGGGGDPERLVFSESTGLLSPEAVADVLCLQERAFGDSGLDAPEVPAE